jgi:hypothetical protein
VTFIDAVALDAPPGTVRVFSRDEITSVPTGIRVSPHEPTLNDALIVLDFAGAAPREVVLVGVVPETLEGGMALSPRVAGAVGRAGRPSGERWQDALTRRDTRSCHQLLLQAARRTMEAQMHFSTRRLN